MIKPSFEKMRRGVAATLAGRFGIQIESRPPVWHVLRAKLE
jgi:hypothetical protein